MLDLSPDPPLTTESSPPPAPLSISLKAERKRKRRKGGAVFWLSVFWMVLVIGSAVLADVLPIPDPQKQFRAAPVGKARLGILLKNNPPNLAHVFGTDANGRDLLSRVIHGSQLTLVIGFLAIAFGLLIGGIVGLAAGYYRGRVEQVLMSITDVLLSFPALVFLIAIVAFIGHKTIHIALAIGILSIAPLARIVRGTTLVYSEREFVLAARTLGAPNRRIIFREILPNVVPAAISFAVIGVAAAIVAEGGLAFLGLSVVSDPPTWGGLIIAGRDALVNKPTRTHACLIPATVLFLTALALNFVGDSLRARFDIREGAL